MADRSDDIKQLFSHLGLNPGDYQEMREKTRALSRGPEGAVSPPAASTRRVSEAPATKTPPAAPQATPVPPTVRLNPLIGRSPAPGAGGEATQRWPLLKAAVETPTRVAQRPEVQVAPAATELRQPDAAEPVPTPPPVAAAPQAPTAEPAASARPPASAKVLGSTSEVATLLKAVEQAKAMERAESDAIERTTRRVVDELQRSRVPAVKLAEPVSAPQPVAAQPVAAAVPVSPPAASPPAAPQAPRPTFFQKPIVVPATAVASPPVVAAKPAAAEPKAESAEPAPASSAIPGSELQSAFQRLVDPERVPQQRFSRLKFNYGASEAQTKPRKPKEENLEDVFSRISGPSKSR